MPPRDSDLLQPPPGNANPADLYTWRPLRLFAVYRLLVAGVLVLSITSGVESLLLSAEQPALFEQASIGYFVYALLMLIFALQFPHNFSLQVNLHTLGDILLLGLLIYFAGLEDNGLGPLLLTAVAGGSIMVGLRTAVTFAAVASIVLLLQNFLHFAQFRDPGVGYTQVGLLGLGLFVAAIATSLLARRARESTALAEKRGLDLANLQALNAHIVQRLQVGAVVVDGRHRVRLLNGAAWNLLEQPEHGNKPLLAQLSPALHQALADWHDNPTREPDSISLGDGMEILPRCFAVGEEGGTLIFLEDLAMLRARVQDAKLVSLGRLTASIAHEIRNPLSAMTHACQLLEEAELADGDRRLLEIIRKQGLRLNGIINSVLRMSRREKPNQDTFSLRAWLADLGEDLAMQHELVHLSLDQSGVDASLQVTFDPDHLSQVLNNLVRNAAEHAGNTDTDNGAKVTLTAGHDARGRPWLDIQDNGKGIAAKHAEHLFEPFFTTASKGTGLGLYLCRELCESNQAKLVLRSAEPPGACFRITFTGPVAAGPAPGPGKD